MDTKIYIDEIYITLFNFVLLEEFRSQIHDAVS